MSMHLRGKIEVTNLNHRRVRNGPDKRVHGIDLAVLGVWPVDDVAFMLGLETPDEREALKKAMWQDEGIPRNGDNIISIAATLMGCDVSVYPLTTKGEPKTLPDLTVTEATVDRFTFRANHGYTAIVTCKISGSHEIDGDTIKMAAEETIVDEVFITIAQRDLLDADE